MLILYSIDIVNFLLDKGASVHDLEDIGQTPLHLAAYGGEPEICQILIDQGAEVDVLDKKGYSPLWYATNFDHFKSVLTLVKAGANPAIDVRGESVLEIAIEHNENTKWVIKQL